MKLSDPTADSHMFRSKLRALFINLALSGAATLTTLGGLEALARWAEMRSSPSTEPIEFVPDWRTWSDEFYHFGQGAPHWPPETQTTRDGLRDNHHVVTALPGVHRVLFLGDSVTYGFGLADQNAYPQILQRLLAAQGAPLEVFNVGAPGWTTRQERIAYERLMRPYRARTVVLAVCLNDVIELHRNLSRPPGWLLALHGRSALVRRLIDAEGRELRSVEALNRAPDGPVARAAFARFSDEVLELRAAVARDGATFGLLIFPYRFQVAAGAPPPRLQARLMEFARAHGLPAQDLLPVLAPLGEGGFIDDNHLSPQGAAAVAESLHAGRLLPAHTSHAARLGARAGGRQPSTEELLEWLRAPDGDLRAAAAWGLGRARLDERAGLALARLAADGLPSVRFEAVRSMAQAEPLPVVRAALLSSLDDPEEAVRLEAARTLWGLPPHVEDVRQLAANLANGDLYVRAFAQEALARLGREAVPAVVPLLAHEDVGVRRRCAKWLARIGPDASSAIEALAHRLEDSDPGVRRLARAALRQIGPAGDSVLADYRPADQDGGLRK